jgi:transposase-like protein
MSNSGKVDSGAAEGARRATGEASEVGRGGKGRWSAKRKMAVVLELLRGEDLETLSRKCAVTAATLSSWRDCFLASGEAGLKIRQKDLVDEQGRRMKSVIAELAMSNELLRERIRQLENANPSLRWRSKP